MSIARTLQSAHWQDDVPTLPIWRFTVDEYHEMIRMGILPLGAPIELLEGWLVKKMIKNPPHTLSAGCTYDTLAALVGPQWHVRNQEPITTDDSEPEPDVSVVRGERRDYPDHHPGPADIGLLIEISDTSLDQDRGQKKRIYALSRIPVYWIINLIDRCVEVYTAASGPTKQPDYTDKQVFYPGDRIPVRLDGAETGQVAVDDLLP